MPNASARSQSQTPVWFHNLNIFRWYIVLHPEPVCVSDNASSACRQKDGADFLGAAATTDSLTA